MGYIQTRRQLQLRTESAAYSEVAHILYLTRTSAIVLTVPSSTEHEHDHDHDHEVVLSRTKLLDVTVLSVRRPRSVVAIDCSHPTTKPNLGRCSVKPKIIQHHIVTTINHLI
jgi:hypothetical protein